MIEPTVFVIDDDPTICEALKWLLESIQLHVETYSNGQAYLQAHTNQHHGCLLVDIRMPVMGGFELLEALNQQHNPIPLIFITGHGDVPMAVRAMQAGAMDFILKPFNDQLLLEKVQKAIALDKKRCSQVTQIDWPKRLAQLTTREREVLELIVAGQHNKEIAYNLNISLSTVEFHRANIMRKLQVRSIAELVKLHLMNKAT